MKTTLFTFLLFMIAAPMVHAADALTVGDNLPERFKAYTEAGKEKNYDSITGERGAVILFVRSADWCFYCKRQLRSWNERAEEFRSLGYNVVSLSYDDGKTLARFRESNSISFPMLTDQGSEMIKAFGILNKNLEEASRFYGVPHPAIYVVSPEGKITHLFKGEGFKERPHIENVYDALSM